MDAINELNALMGCSNSNIRDISFEPDLFPYDEIVFAIQEWGIKNNLRLFGITIAEYGVPGNKSEPRPRAKAYFADTGFKSMIIISFDLKQNIKSGKVIISESRAIGKRIKWPIKFARTKWESHNVDPVCPLYWVLVERRIILPFRSTLKVKEWVALPFEDMSGIKSTEI
jgi:hypothetical protein